jgi:hypothetical protein
MSAPSNREAVLMGRAEGRRPPSTSDMGQRRYRGTSTATIRSGERLDHARWASPPLEAGRLEYIPATERQRLRRLAGATGSST